jgi:hypothetical protein
MVACALLGVSATALADAREVLADVKDNGRIDGCYTRAELREALALANDDERLYGEAVDLIKDAQIRHSGPGCNGNLTIPRRAVADDSGSGLALWVGLAAAIGAVAAGAGWWGRRGRDEAGG